jgi:hypothetical protein
MSRAVVFASVVSAAFALVACSDSSSSGGDQPGIDAQSETIDQDAVLEGALDSTPTTTANGSVGAWKTLTPMPLARANHCAVFGNGFLFVIGGNRSSGGGFVATDLIHGAKVNDDGTIGAWFEAGHTPSAVTECTAVARGNELWVSDGIYATPGEEGKLYHATIDDTGNVSLFDTASLLPPGMRSISKSAWVVAGTLRVASDDLSDPDAGVGTTGVLRADLATGTFVYDGVDPVWRGRPEYAFTGSFAYFIGGYAAGSTAPILSVDGAVVGPDGKLTGQFTTTALTKPTMFGQAIAVDDFVFLVGGRGAAFGGTARADVLSAPVHADGTLGDWAAQTSMPEPRSNFQLTLGGDFAFVTGGGNTDGGLDNAWSARVRF